MLSATAGQVYARRCKESFTSPKLFQKRIWWSGFEI